MQIPRIAPEPRATADFFEDALTALGALCDRSWHDRLEVVAEGAAARLWREEPGLHTVTLRFAETAGGGAIDASSDVFPGCPLTFRLAEALRSEAIPCQRLVLAGDGRPAPDAAVAEKIWHAHIRGTTRWRLTKPFAAAHHFSLVASIRCEVQAIDQHWSLHRLALSLVDGAIDQSLAGELATLDHAADSGIEWPSVDAAHLQQLIQRSIEFELAEELAPIRARQQRFLTRELSRIDGYFHEYESELASRGGRSRAAGAQEKLKDRLRATKTEHARRREDQIARHELHIVPHVDALLIIAEPAWRATVNAVRDHREQQVPALFVPRARRWVLGGGSDTTTEPEGVR